MSQQPSVLVLVPTFDEVDSLAATLDRLLDAAPDVHVLVIDDASPDGTGELADAIAAADARVRVLHRPGRQGLGTAYVAGMREALDRGVDLVVEMDADGSHPAAALPRLLRRSVDAELVIGSRWVEGGSIRDWPLRRQAISRFANVYARVLLGIPVRDITAGYRVYRAEALRALDLDEVRSDGYCFQIDMTRRIVDTGGAVAEEPIEFVERRQGASKMTRAVIVESAVKVAGWGIGRRAAGVAALVRGLRASPLA